MLKKFLHKIKRKNGSSTIEFVISMMTLLLLFIVVLEFFMLGHKYISISSFANNITQTIALQGGIQSSAPRGFSAGSTRYLTSSGVMQNINSLANMIGQDSNSITVKIKYTTRGGSWDNTTTRTIDGSSNIRIDYGCPFEVIVECNVRNLISNSLVSSFNKNFTIKRVKGNISQFEHEYN